MVRASENILGPTPSLPNESTVVANAGLPGVGEGFSDSVGFGSGGNGAIGGSGLGLLKTITAAITAERTRTIPMEPATNNTRDSWCRSPCRADGKLGVTAGAPDFRPSALDTTMLLLQNLQRIVS